MRRPPRPPQESVLGGGLPGAVLRTGFLLAATVLVAEVVAQQMGRPWQLVIFVVLGLAQLGIALAVRATRGRRGP
jgi:Ca2+-transporting ATPase